MQNRDLAKDYILRCEHRLHALQVLFDRQSWPDVVREAQEVVELALKALLRQFNVEPPRVHDVSHLLEAHRNQLPAELQGQIKELGKISRNLRRDRELAYYGSEDLTPLEFYNREDGEAALKDAKWVVTSIRKFIP